MNGASDELFPNSGFAQYQDACITRGHEVDLPQHLTQRRTLPHDLRETGFAAQFVFGERVLSSCLIFKPFDLGATFNRLINSVK
jgi:hypothetical protein